jgi:very-short-patch-repair endonuclease
MSVESAVEAVRRLGGTARTSQLRAVGTSRTDLTNAIREGQLLRPRNGVYALRETSRPIVEALSHRGMIGCVTAARDHGLWILDGAVDEPVHTWVRPRHRPTRLVIDPDVEEGVCCVFHRDLPVDGPSLVRVGVLHCLVQILRCKGDEAFFAALESGLRQGLIPERGRDILRRHVPLRCRWLIDFARSDADSGLESLLRLRLHLLGISLQTQVVIDGVGKVDFVADRRLIIEVDGKENHAGESQRHKDLARDAAASALGYETLRFDYSQIMHDWHTVQPAILAALARVAA